MDVRESAFNMFDEVKIKVTPLTIVKGLAGKKGTVSGITVPSQTKLKVIGKMRRDLAVNIMLESNDKQIWFAEDLLINYGPKKGLTFSIGNKHFRIDEFGNTVEDK